MSISDRVSLLDAARACFRIAERSQWQSRDPYDILLSPALGAVRRVSPFAARLLIQAGKRMGPALRSALGVPRHEEAKAISDYLEAAALLAETGVDWALQALEPLAGRLVGRAIQADRGAGWGLEFPYVSRYVNVPARTPNIYQTTNALVALIRAHAILRDDGLLDWAARGFEFIQGGLGCYERESGLWYRYWAGNDTPIVNIQASAAALFSMGADALARPDLRLVSARLVETVVSAQNPDGSWPYSTDGRANFVDGFHTGFILQSLAYLNSVPAGLDERGKQALERGYHFFTEHLITPGGLPRGFADGPASTDTQNFAQCVQTLALCGGDADLALARAMWDALFHLKSLRVEERLRGTAENDGDLELRWAFGPAVLATAHLVKTLAQRGA